MKVQRLLLFLLLLLVLVTPLAASPPMWRLYKVEEFSPTNRLWHILHASRSSSDCMQALRRAVGRFISTELTDDVRLIETTIIADIIAFAPLRRADMTREMVYWFCAPGHLHDLTPERVDD